MGLRRVADPSFASTRHRDWKVLFIGRPIARLETAVMGACCSRASDDVDGDDDRVVARDVSDAFHEATCDAFVIDWDEGATEDARAVLETSGERRRRAV